jgi:3-phenylpropionate/cinnamic acid dioxygenase small subunit
VSVVGADALDVAAQVAISRTLAEYCQLCDDGEFPALVERFAPDGSFAFGGDVVTGREALEGWFARNQRPELRGKHFTSNAIIDVDDGRARAVSDFLFLRRIDGVVTPQVAGRYRDTFVKLGGRWLIERREVEVLPPPDR